MKIKDNGWKDHYKALRQLSSMKVQIGAVGEHDKEPGQKKSISNAALVRIHNNGVPSAGIPATFFVNKGLSENVKYLSDLTKKLLNKHHSKKGFDVQKIGDGLGVAMVKIIRATMMSNLAPVLSPKYLAKKVKDGYSNLRLIKTGQLKNSITHGVKS